MFYSCALAVREGYIKERFLDCACRHPSQKARRMEEKNRQTPLGMTSRGDALVAPASSRRFYLAMSERHIRRQDGGGTRAAGRMAHK